jgi:ribonucleoside-diphosphate reductase alpha subunit
MNTEDFVIKRNGEKQIISFDKILTRVKKLGSNDLRVNYTNLVQKIIDRLYDNIPTTQIDELTAQQCASLITTHGDYGELASRILASNHHKNTPYDFYTSMEKLYNFKDINDEQHPLVSDEFWHVVQNNKTALEEIIDYERDYLIDYFGFKTLERAYLMKVNGKIVERPQHMWMRVAVGIWGDNLEKVKTTYDGMSQKYFTHATPTLFNAGTPRSQLSSCYLLAMKDDSISGIYETLSDCAKISKWAGGIGLHIHNIRASGSHIRGTNGKSNGIVPMLRVFNNTARYVDQGGGRRNGSFAIYIEPWHGDIMDFLDMKKNHGDEEARARDLFYALWIPDEFMRRVKEDKMWTLMCPDRCTGLSDAYGDDFDTLYKHYEKTGKGIRQVKAREVWFKILDSQIETGTPYMLYKDACNKKSNQKNLGTIKSSNLCTEIIEYSGPDQTAVCNLASIGLPKFVKNKEHDWKNVNIYTKDGCIYCQMAKNLMDENNIKYQVSQIKPEEIDEFKTMFKSTYGVDVKTFPQVVVDQKYIGPYTEVVKHLRKVFDYDHLHEITKIITDNLNKVIDINFYPTEKTRRSNMLHRPIGIGVQGLADTLALMDIAFHSNEAKEINKNIFETIYHASLEKSNEIAIERREAVNFMYNSMNDNHFSNDVNSHKHVTTQEFAKYSNIAIDCLDIDTLMALSKFNIKRAEINLRYEGDEFMSGAYSSFLGSPAFAGTLQFDMWGVKPSLRYDWNALKQSIVKYGIRNSLLLAPMPTASTSQILGNNECFEPFTSNIYVRRTIAGEFVIINKHLIKELIGLDKWDNDIKNNIIANGGSVQQLDIPKCLKEKYKIVWEIPMKHILEMAKDRGAYICQSQSTNLWMKNPDYKKLTAMHMFAWKSGLKTGIYYLRTKSKAAAQQFTIEPPKNPGEEKQMEDDEECLMCGA